MDRSPPTRPASDALGWPRRTPRLALLVCGIGSLLTGIWGGLLRLPMALPLPVEHANWITFHGPLMVGGFLGTVIGLERAVGLRAGWAFAAPLLTGGGAVALMTGILGPGPRWAMVGGSAVFLLVSLRIVSIQRSLSNAVMALGTGAWVGGNLLWVSGQEIPQVVLWWVAFVLLIILGERMELTRFQRPSAGARPWMGGAVGILGVGLGASLMNPRLGGVLVGTSLLGLATWLGRYDLARRTIRQAGLPRFMAVCLLSGYAWLAFAGLIFVSRWPQTTGTVYDAALHGFFVGFVFAMILGHAPVIFPAVLGVPVYFLRTGYVPLAVLHASLILRVIGDLDPWAAGRAWGAAGNGIAVGLFLINTVASIVLGLRQAPTPVGSTTPR